VSRSSDDLQVEEKFKLDWMEYLRGSDFMLGAVPKVDLWPQVQLNSRSGYTRISLPGSAELALGLGYGRFRDAWPLAKAIRLIGILRDCDVLESEPKIGPLTRLADFISSSWKLFYAHDRAAKFYYDSLETILLDARVITGPLPAYVLMRLDDSLTVGFDAREFGSRLVVGPVGILAGNLTFYPAHGGETSEVYRGISKFWGTRVEYDFARPIGLRWTTGATGKYELDWQDGSTYHSLTAALTATYQIANRLMADFEAGLSGRAEVARGLGSTSTMTANGNASLGFQFYVTDRLLLKTTLGSDFFRRYAQRKFSSPQSQLFLQIDVAAGPERSGIW
jgi:hypothetical protein